jgi:hypothetical protein
MNEAKYMKSEFIRLKTALSLILIDLGRVDKAENRRICVKRDVIFYPKKQSHLKNKIYFKNIWTLFVH